MGASPLRVAVIGGGWAGLAAAVEASRRGAAVTLYEMAPQLGGRARAVTHEGLDLDNGQHILIGAYRQTLGLMDALGVDLGRAFLRMPLRVTYPDGAGLQLPTGAPVLAFLRAIAGYAGWRWRDKLAMLLAASGWTLRGFRCDASLTVEQLTAQLPQAVRDELLDPLCVAALNTPSSQASAAVFLRVLKDALFSGPGSADLLLPMQRLSHLLPEPALQWLLAQGASVQLKHRVNAIERDGAGWHVDNVPHDAVILACTAVEAARLTARLAPAWSEAARQLRYEPIVTVYTRSPGARLPQPMMALHSDAQSPAQFVFDLGQLSGPGPEGSPALEGIWAFVISGAASWIERGIDATTEASLQQGRRDLAAWLKAPLETVRAVTEKRATFLCLPRLQRPEARIADRLWAAGDYIAGPYPATLEGAVMSGLAAARSII